jgi:hypothetical protein
VGFCDTRIRSGLSTMLPASVPAAVVLAATCDPQKAVCKDTAGPGVWLRLFVVVAVVGIAVTAWFLVRGYRDQDGRRDE